LLGVSVFIRDEKSVDIIRVIANGILAAEIEGELTDRGGELPLTIAGAPADAGRRKWRKYKALIAFGGTSVSILTRLTH